MIYFKYIKRIIDLVLSTFLLIVLSWLFILILFSYFLTLNLPVFFTQLRIGRDQVPFKLFKFRTLSMLENEVLQKRRFVLGDFMRATSLDELPQLFNVLKGEMSLIGPRPLPVEYLPLISTDQNLRHAVKPGMTGWTQVNGRHTLPWKEKFMLDIYYVKHVSFLLDLKISLKTLFVLLSFKKDISLEEKPFTGT